MVDLDPVCQWTELVDFSVDVGHSLYGKMVDIPSQYLWGRVPEFRNAPRFAAYYKSRYLSFSYLFLGNKTGF